MSNKIIGIVDEANPGNKEDTLDIGKHSKALTTFITYTSTPMTIGIQGEWGSGKTSLLNKIYHSLEREDKYKQIWINSWEHSLLTTPEESLLKIINEIIKEMLGSDSQISHKDKIKNIATNVFKGALRVGATAIAGSEAGKVTNELLNQESGSIRDLKKQLELLSKEICELSSNPFEKIIIYVDDLDRIEPKDAVRILELLKNIFSVPNCVFVLAIDYQVVVKGLREKFGKQTDENEWEFRAFFDKIIQLPFMMPMGQYNIGKYVGDLLESIGFFEDSSDHEDYIGKSVQLSIGGNPRSLKRLVNSLTLIDIFSNIELDDEDQVCNTKTDEDTKKILLFTMVCIQISYPILYELLTKDPDFTKWNSNTAFEVTKLIEEKDKDKFKKDFDIVKNTEDFDEEWEESVYRICYPNPRYKARVINISRIFSFIKDELLKDKQEDIEDIIADVLGDTAVTNVTSTDETHEQRPKKREKKGQRVYYDNLDMYLLKYENRLSQEHKTFYQNIVNDYRSALGANVEIKYLEWGASMSVNKHRLGTFSFTGNGGGELMLLKSFENGFKLPRINDLKIRHVRKYKGIDKPTTSAFSEYFIIEFDNKDDYENNKTTFFSLIKQSCELAQNHWKDRLQIRVKSSYVKGKITPNIQDDKEMTDQIAWKYLSDDWHD